MSAGSIDRSPRPRRALLGALILLLAPALAWGIGGWVEHQAGPRWLLWAYDPDYPYLLNSLNIAEGHAPRHTDHPGTPVQVLGGAVLLAHHLVTSPGVSVREQVLRDPEAALHDLGLVIRVIGFVSLLAFGAAARRFTGSIACAAAAQLATLLSPTALTALYRLEPEPLALSISLLVSAAALLALANPAPLRPRFPAVSGLLTAAGLATKVTFAPVALIPWGVLLGAGKRGRRLAALYIAATALALPIFLAPILPQLVRVFWWFERLALRGGTYGADNGNLVINPGRYGADLRQMIRTEPVLAGFAAAGLALAAAFLLPPLSRRLDQRGRRLRLLLLATAATQALQIAMTAKQPMPRYMVPAVGTMGLSVCLAFTLTRSALAGRGRQVLVTLGAAALAGSAWWAAVRTAHDVEDLSSTVAPRLAVAQRSAELLKSGAVVAWTYGSSSPQFALLFGDEWAGGRYSQRLREMIPGLVVYRLSGVFLTSGRTRVLPPQLEAWAAQGRLYYQGRPRETPAGYTRSERIAPRDSFTEGVWQIWPVAPPRPTPDDLRARQAPN